MKNLLQTIILGLLILLYYSCTSHKPYKKFILEETFDSNDKGWVEEKTNYHEADIRNGKYFIHCIDTSFGRTSGAALDFTYLIGLPKTYEIKTSAKLIGGEQNNKFGIILCSASIQYQFSIYDNGEIEIVKKEMDVPTVICSTGKKGNNFYKNHVIEITIAIDYNKFKYFVNGELICNGDLQTKQWSDLRLFVNTGTAVEFDYLTIQELKMTNKN